MPRDPVDGWLNLLGIGVLLVLFSGFVFVTVSISIAEYYCPTCLATILTLILLRVLLPARWSGPARIACSGAVGLSLALPWIPLRPIALMPTRYRAFYGTCQAIEAGLTGP